MKLDKTTAVIISSTMAVEFVFDTLLHSVAVADGGPFKFVIPRGKELRNLLIIGFISGLALDFILHQVEKSQMNELEKKLDKLVEREKKKILAELEKLMIKKNLKRLSREISELERKEGKEVDLKELNRKFSLFSAKLAKF